MGMLKREKREVEGMKRVLPTCSEVTHRAGPGLQQLFANWVWVYLAVL
jgi:hypothetical protein